MSAPANLLRRAADDLQAQQNTAHYLPAAAAAAIWDAAPGSLAGDDDARDLAFAAATAAGVEYRDHDVRMLRAAADHLDIAEELLRRGVPLETFR